MNRAILRVFSSPSARLIPRIYASSKAPTTSAADHHAHDDHGHGHGHGHGHHHHEPELRKTQAWRHHSGIQSKYENQSEDHGIAFAQGLQNENYR